MFCNWKSYPFFTVASPGLRKTPSPGCGNTRLPRSFRRHRKCPESGNFLSVEPHVCTQWELISSYWLLFGPFPLIWDGFRSPSKLSKSRHPSQPGAPPIGVRPSWSKSDGLSLRRLSSKCLGPLIQTELQSDSPSCARVCVFKMCMHVCVLTPQCDCWLSIIFVLLAFWSICGQAHSGF